MRGAKKILLVDDHPMLRAGLGELINDQDDLEVCGEAGDAKEALQCIRRARPHLAMVDISLGGRSGLNLIRDIRATYPQVRILVVSMHEEMLYVQRALRAGAHGYVLKKAGGEMLLKAIRQVLAGKIFLSQEMSGKIMERFCGRAEAERNSALQALSDAEFEVFQLIGQGHGLHEIAEALCLSIKTVDAECAHIKTKLRVKQWTELVRCAVRWSEEGRL